MGDAFHEMLTELRQEAEHIRNHYWMYGFEHKPTLAEALEFLEQPTEEEMEIDEPDCPLS